MAAVLQILLFAPAAGPRKYAINSFGVEVVVTLDHTCPPLVIVLAEPKICSCS